jgi:F0F1-type ATP synthase membrane subunit b/b'
MTIMDATFWALVGLVIFLGIVVYVKVPGMIAKALDKRADKIRNELEEARKLREEAQALLAEYQKKRKEAEKEAAEIVSGQARGRSDHREAKQKTEEYVAAAPRWPSRRSGRPSPMPSTRSAPPPLRWRWPPRRRSSAPR